MKLIGIYIHPESEKISKVLKPGWFPFGDYPEPFEDQRIDYQRRPAEIENIYSPNHGIRISVTAIVGKNGSGKSSLLDMMYRIINNFAIRCIGKGMSQNKYRYLNFVYGVYADLYYEFGRTQYRIRCRNTEVSFEATENGVFKEFTFSKTKSNKIRLSRFFYTIATNYSLYAYDPDDYKTETHPDIPKDKDNGQWIDGLFHKNDGYLTPIVLTPFREDGSIQGKREKHLAEQRINTLALMADAHGTDFLPGYQAYYMTVGLIPDFEKGRKESLRKEVARHSKWMDSSMMTDVFQQVWIEQIKRRLGKNLKEDQTFRFRLALFYLAYKSLKLTMKYEDYSRAFHLYNDNEEFGEPESQRTYYEQVLRQRAEHIVNLILNDIYSDSEEHNHLLLKIEQTWRDIAVYTENGDFEWYDSEQREIHPWLMRHQVHTYSELFSIMPPPYIKMTLTFRKKEWDERRLRNANWHSLGDANTMTLASMSSGERHLLYALSYVLYHIKNLQSVKADTNRVKYRNICLIFDEIEMFLHPEYQRRFIAMLLEALEWTKIHGTEIKSIQILIATHSPFTLTDIFTHNTLYLKDGRAEKVEEESFGANYYDMLANSFFFDSSAIGEIASKYISKCAKERDTEKLWSMLSYVGDKLICNYIYNQNIRNKESEE